MKNKTKLDGTGIAIVTPFHNYGTIDFGGLERLLNFIIEGGVDFIVALGTTSEAATLTADEESAVMDVVLETVNGRIPIVMGIGGNSTQGVINKIKKTNFEGIEAILSVTPYYNKPNQRGIYNHFKAISGTSPVSVILYNIPGRTASNISSETTLKLANDFDNIVAVKEASGNMGQIMDIIREKPDGFQIFSGDDALTYPMMALGATGVISVVGNAFPREFSDMVRLLKAGKYKDALQIHYSLIPIIRQMFADGNPAGVKVALEAMGLIKNHLRLPMVKANKSVNLTLNKLVSEYETPLT